MQRQLKIADLTHLVLISIRLKMPATEKTTIFRDVPAGQGGEKSARSIDRGCCGMVCINRHDSNPTTCWTCKKESTGPLEPSSIILTGQSHLSGLLASYSSEWDSRCCFSHNSFQKITLADTNPETTRAVIKLWAFQTPPPCSR